MGTNSALSIQVRSSVHFIAAILTMWIYGGQVCPLVESLNPATWLIELILIYLFFMGLRIVTIRLFINKVAEQKRVISQFYFELIIAFGIGIVIILVNNIVFGFPSVESGLKMLIGVLSLGFFNAVDMALTRERLDAIEFSNHKNELILDDNYFPMTRKFAIVATFTAVIVSMIILLVILKDLGWMMNVKTIDAETARLAVMKEIFFITIVFLIYIFNIIISYAKNLKLSMERENNALMSVAGGDLSSHVVVSTNDEFGVMAQYTNIMIRKLAKRTKEVQQTRDVTILALATLAETRDNETGAHILRTQHYLKALALSIKEHPKFKSYLDRDTINLLYKSAPLHDIGKVGIPDNILLKPGKLDKDEFNIMKKHCEYGRDAIKKASENLEGNNFLKIAQEIAYSHHEKWDGTGYPLGLEGYDIPIGGRLMALADVYDALITKRVYKPAFSHEKSMGILKEGRGTHFDPDILDAFLSIEDEIIEIAGKYSDKE